MAIEEEFLDKFVGIRHHIHQHPELSEHEYETTEYIKEFLRDLDIKIIDSGLETGVIAEIGNDKNNIIGLRCDIDALPIFEETGLPYASVNDGVMHACGHDFHTTSLLATAELLKANEDKLKGTVRLFFQPAEENFQGSQAVIKTGLLSDLSALVGFHNFPDLPLGTIGYRQDKLMASVDRIKVKIKGVGSHAAHPHEGNDPIVTGSQIITNLQSLISRHIPSKEEAVLSITHVQSGSTWNVVPNTFEFEGTLRTLNEDIRKKLKNLFYKTVENTADIYGQTVDIEWTEGSDCLDNDLELFNKLIPSISDNFLDAIKIESNLTGEDFSRYHKYVPIFFAFIGTGKNIPLHNPKFLIDDKALIYSINYYIDVVQKLLNIKLDI